jgi:hypothetical protein
MKMASPTLGVSWGGSLLFTLIITLVAWNIQIEHRAFHCSDDVGFGFFWESMDAHERAGDTLAPGWTWAKLRAERKVYMVAFFCIWFTCAFVARRFFVSNRTKRRGTEAWV